MFFPLSAIPTSTRKEDPTPTPTTAPCTRSKLAQFRSSQLRIFSRVHADTRTAKRFISPARRRDDFPTGQALSSYPHADSSRSESRACSMQLQMQIHSRPSPANSANSAIALSTSLQLSDSWSSDLSSAPPARPGPPRGPPGFAGAAYAASFRGCRRRARPGAR